MRRAFWDDLNYPARLATLAAAGLPLIQYDNSGAVVATQSLSRELDIGLFSNNVAELGRKLRDEVHTEQIRANVWRNRERFTFDYHAERLLQFFRQVAGCKQR